MKIRFAHSPDSDDAFMFYGIEEGKIDTGDFEVEGVLSDIETLNNKAFKREYEATAVSFHTYPYIAKDYYLMSCGASIGFKYGPIIVSKKEISYGGLKGKKIGVPGKFTTAYLLLKLFSGDREAILLSPAGSSMLPFTAMLSPLRGSSMLERSESIAVQGCLNERSERKHERSLRSESIERNKAERNDLEEVFMPFDKIMGAVEKGDIDCGLLIHEGQITYQEKNLVKVADLGEWWFEKTNLPTPLGCNVVRRDLGLENAKKISEILKKSILYSLEHKKEAMEYASKFARGLNISKVSRFVDMYVNKRTIEYSKEDIEAIKMLLDEGWKKGIIPHSAELDIV